MAFKMKGHSLPGPNQRQSPAKGIWDDIKSGASKAYDKASQVGMGVKKAAGEVGTYKGDYTDKTRGLSERLGSLKKAYTSGRDTEKRADVRGGGKGTYKGGRSDEKAFMEQAAKKYETGKATRRKEADKKAGGEGYWTKNSPEFQKAKKAKSSSYEKKAKASSIKQAKVEYTKGGKVKKSPAKCPLLALAGPIMGMLGKKKE